MPTLNKTAGEAPIYKTFNILGSTNALAYLDQIMAAVSGTASGEDTLSVLNRKLEAAGVLATGTSDPVFANETALFFHNTSSKALFVRGSSAYESLIAEEDIIEAGTTTPVPNANTAWIVLRTDTPKRFFLKERSGSPGSYTYTLQGPFFAGSYQLRIILSAQDNPVSPSISWDWENANFNISGGDWAVNTPNPKWFRIVECPNTTNTTRMTPLIRVGDPDASDILVSGITGDGNLPSSVNNVQELADWIDNDATFATTTTTPTTQQDSLIQTEEYDDPNNPNSLLTNDDNNQFVSFSIDRALTDYRSNYGEPIFLEANATVEVQGTSAPNQSITFEFRVLDSSGTPISNIESVSSSVEAGSSPIIRNLRIAGNLPSNISAGRLQVRVPSGGRGGAIAGTTRIRLELRSDLKSDEIIVDSDDFGNNLIEIRGLNDLDDALQQVDDFPLQRSDYYDFSWPSGPNGISDTTTLADRTRNTPLHQLIQNVNQRTGHAYVARIFYDAQILGGGAVTSGYFRHHIYSLDSSNTATLLKTDGPTQADPQAKLDNQNMGLVVSYQSEIVLPDNTDEIRIIFEVPSGQNDARLVVTNYHIDPVEGVDPSGFTEDNRILDNDAFTLPTIAQQVYDWNPTAANIAVNTTGFDGNLNSSSNNVQLVAQVVDDLVAGTINNAQFANPNNFIGGLREPIPTTVSQTNLVNDPANVQQAFVKTDYMLQLAYNPYQLVQNLDYFDTGAATVRDTFELSAMDTEVDSDRIDIPNEITELSGSDLLVRVRFRVSAITGTFQGTIRIINGSSNILGVGPISVDSADYSVGDFINFERRITRTRLTNLITSGLDLKIRFNRTSTTGAMSFNEGYTYVTDTPPEVSGATGSSEAYRETIVWVAGGTATSRYTTVNVHQTLLPGHRWSDYDWLQFNFDTASGADLVKPCIVTSNAFQSTDGYGTIWHTDLYAILVRPVGTGNNQFEIRWNGGGSLGLRRVLGINTAHTN